MKLLLILAQIFYVSCLPRDHSCQKTIQDPADPELTIPEGCYILENSLVEIPNSLCPLIITDCQGHLKNINYIINDPELQDTFEFKYETDPADDESTVLVFLLPKKKLKYDERSLYKFGVTVTDEVDLSQNAEITVQVYKPPKWNIFPSVVKVNEEEDSTIPMVADIGDGSNQKHINYCLKDDSVKGCPGWMQNEVNCIITVDRSNGMVGISAVDREAGVSNFTITVLANYLDDATAETIGDILVLVDDIDDNPAQIKFENKTQIIVVNQNDRNISIQVEATDPDLGSNSEYSAAITVPDQLQEAFELSPNKGSGTTTFEIKINPQKIDYTDSNLNYFTLKFGTTGVKNTQNVDTLLLKFKLEANGGTGSMIMSTTWIVLISVVFSILNVGEY